MTVAVVGSTLAVLAAVFAVGILREPDAGSVRSGGQVAAAGPAVTPTTTAPAVVPPAGVATPGSVPADGAGGDLAIALDGDCTIEATRLALGDSGPDVQCLQQGLVTAGFLSGSISGRFDQATYDAVETLQTERALFVDGIVGRETAISVGVWPDEAALVIRTPPPSPGAVDSWGYPLSSVSSVGADAPPVPENSGSGRRVVYERAGQRVWAIDDDNQVIRSWLVSGSKYGNEQPGFHEVYSRSEQSTAWNGQAKLPLMVRYQQTAIGAIGFHGIPTHVSDGTAYQTEDELGTRLSGGCQRQANPDAAFMWDFAQVGTPVVVI